MVTWTHEASRTSREEKLRDSLNRSRDDNGVTPTTFFVYLDLLTKEKAYLRLEDARGRPFPDFRSFIKTARPHGLGLHDQDELKKILELEHKEEREPYLRKETVERMAEMRQRVHRLLFEEVQPERAHGRPRSGEEKESGAFFSGPQGNATTDSIVARLKRDDPELASKVINGEIKPNAAALKKGWRKPRILITTPRNMIKHLRQYMSREDQLELAELLKQDSPGQLLEVTCPSGRSQENPPGNWGVFLLRHAALTCTKTFSYLHPYARLREAVAEGSERRRNGRTIACQRGRNLVPRHAVW
jgi:hypothetical protein